MNRLNSAVLLPASLLCLGAGAAYFYIEQKLSVLAIILLALGGILLITGRLARTRTSPSLAKAIPNRWKRILSIISVIGFCGLFLMASNYLAYSSGLRWDVTKNQQHTLSKNTLTFIADLPQAVTLTAFYVGLPPKYLQDTFSEYERVSKGLISTEIIDPVEQIAYAAKFGNVVNGDESKVIVQSGKNRKDVDFSKSSLSEEKIANAIAAVTRSQKHACFLIGHQELSIRTDSNTGLSKFKQLLASNNITSAELMLGITKDIPGECDVLVIAGPKTELTVEETLTINQFLKNGGDALVLIEHTLVGTTENPITEAQQHLNPSLNNLLNPWGLQVESDVVVDLSNHVGGDAGSPATKNYGQHKAITDGLDYTFYIRPRSIRVLEQRRPSIKYAPIVSTTSAEQSWGESNRDLDVLFNPGQDTPGPVVLSYVLFEAKEGQESSDTRIIAFTDADFLSNAYIDQYSNAQMGLNVVNWLAELDYQVFLEQKDIEVERLDLTSKQRRQLLVVLFLIPFLIALSGLLVWQRRTA